MNASDTLSINNQWSPTPEPAIEPVQWGFQKNSQVPVNNQYNFVVQKSIVVEH